MSPVKRLECAALCVICSSPLAAGQPSFQLLPNASVWNISGDGTTVVGMSGPDADGQFVAMRWREGLGVQLLGGLPQPFTGVGTAFGVNHDGTVVVGRNFFSTHSDAFRWTEAGGMAALGNLPGALSAAALATSADGAVVVGRSSNINVPGFPNEAFRWTEEAGMLPLRTAGNLAWGGGQARGISADGTVITGFGTRPGGNGSPEPFRWTQETGLMPIFAPNAFPSGWAYGISADGSTIVGSILRPGGGPLTDRQAFYWRADTGVQLLPLTPGWSGIGEARDASADGSVILGDGSGSDWIWVWTQATGHRYLHDILTTDFGVDLTGYTLELARGISDDGTRITGLAWNHATGFHQPFIATIPSPAAATLLLIWGASVRSQRRRGRRDSQPYHSQVPRCDWQSVPELPALVRHD